MKRHAPEIRLRLPGAGSRLRGFEWLFLLLGLAALDIYLWVNASALLYQAYSDWAFDQRLRGLEPTPAKFAGDEISALFGIDRAKPEPPVSPSLPPKGEPSGPEKPPAGKSPAPSEIIGRLDIPNLHLSVMVREGADAGTLRRAVGHIPGTALPGGPGNIGLAGHRDTFFRPLRDIRKDDAIELQTENGSYRYRVESTRIVGPRDMQVLASSNQETLTLVTCYPFYYVGSAPKRFIVRAALVSQMSKTRRAQGE